MAVAWTTLRHFAISALMKAANSSRVDGAASMVFSVSRSRTSGELMVVTRAALSRSRIGLDTPAGTQIAYQLLTSNPEMPPSATVGTSGKAVLRFSDETASARVRPALMAGSCSGRLPNMPGTCPPITSCSAGAPPL